MSNKKYFCYEIHKNLSIWSRNGSIVYNPCSFYQGNYSQSDSVDISQAWNSDGRQQLINMINQDQKIPGCNSCYQAEDNGLQSRRLSSQCAYEQWHQDTNIDLSAPQGLDYSVGNLCNLKCVICDPSSSSQWIPDYQKLYPEKNINYLKYQKNNQIEISNDESLKNIISVHFHGGGEPLLSNVHVNLLKRIRSVKGLDDVRVFYNTNGTITVTDEVLKLWEECRLIELYFSIDDVSTRFEYQRTGAAWDQLVSNLNWYYHNMPHNHMFKINCAWSYLNLFYLDKLVDWHQTNFSSNRYKDPTELIFQKVTGPCEINHLSLTTYNKLKQKFQNYPQLLELVHTLSINDQPHNNFWKYIDRLDQIRNMQFKSVCPEWSNLIS
jgi:Radical SAM superfamily/4Fe-4S single cluster domain